MDSFESDSDSEADVVIVGQDELSNYNPDHILPKSPEVIKAIRTWLRPTAYDLPSGEYRKHLASHMGGTGDWLTSTTAYQEWLQNGDRGLLWIQGVPGSGKSVMAAKLADELKVAHPGCPVLFFFFRQIIKSNHTPQRLLRDWLDQVLEYSPPLQQQLEKYVKENRNIGSMSIQDLFKDLRMAFARLPGQVFCVADALDEMDRGNDDFLAGLGSLGNWRPAQVKVLLTSRPVAKLEVPLRGVPCVRMRLEEAQVDDDISAFVRNSLKKSSIPKENWEKITDAVPGRANGIFLYAKLAMDAFLEPNADIDNVLFHLPTDLNVLYTRLLHEHAARSGVPQDVQHLLLQAVTHASRPLRLLELADLMRSNLPDSDTRDLRVTKDIIRVACGPLLEVLPDETVSVVHHSLTEYLKGMTRSDEEHGDLAYYPVLKPGPTHARLATACLQYLLSGCLQSVKVTIVDQERSNFAWFSRYRRPEPNQQLTTLTLTHPFSKYAIHNWHQHTRQSETAGHAQGELLPDLAALLEDPTSRKAWLQLAWPTSPNGAGNVTALHIAGHTGLVAYTTKLLESMPVDQLDSQGKSALWWAANSGHAETIEVLFSAGAAPDRDELVYGLKPLHRAAEGNHYMAVAKLLELGVSPLTKKTKDNPQRHRGNVPRTAGESPLMYAATKGHVETVKVMIPYLDQENLQAALSLSAAAQQPKVSFLIIRQPGFHINYSSSTVGTPLNRACQCLDVNSVRFLLEAGADPNFPKPEPKSETYGCNSAHVVAHSCDRYAAQEPMPCLHILSTRDDPYRSRWKESTEVIQEIFSLLVSYGAEINRQDENGKTALHAAGRSSVMTKLLVHAGANANLVDKTGCTPLHLTSSADVISILVEDGDADINLVPNDGQTAIFRLLGGLWEEATLALLQYQPDVNATDAGGNGPLHHHLCSPRVSKTVIAELIRRGADPNLRNNRGCTPLLSVCHLDGEVVDMLLEAGADLNAADDCGSTLLFHALTTVVHGLRGAISIKDLIYLVDKGVSVSHRDNRGRTILHQAVHSLGINSARSITIIRDVAKLGVDIQAVDKNGNTLLHEAASWPNNGYPDMRHFDVVQSLVEMGLNLEQRNHDGQTMLHMLCRQSSSHGHCDNTKVPIDYVISNMKTVNVADYNGVTPLHITCLYGERCTKKLLDNGANAAARTHQGMSALHMAARAREPNVLGMLLDALKKQSKQVANSSQQPKTDSSCDTEEYGQKIAAAWFAKQVNAKPDFEVQGRQITRPDQNYTALHFACQSGLSASVKLLLDLGIDLHTHGLFDACEGFDAEDERWRIYQEPAEPPLRLEHTCRQYKAKYPTHHRPGSILPAAKGRLDDVLDLLLQHGINPPETTAYGSQRHSTEFTDVWDNSALPYAQTCIQRALYKHSLATNTSHAGSPVQTDDGLVHRNIAQATESSIRQLLEEKRPNRREDVRNANFALKFLANRQYHNVELLQQLGVDFCVTSSYSEVSILGLLASHGFSELLERTGMIEAQKKFSGGEWHAWKDHTRPGLCHSGTTASESENKSNNNARPCEDINPLLCAVRRHQPNMPCVRILVEKLGVNPDEILDMAYGRKTSALLEAATGSSWWNTYQLLPYLMEAGANLEVTDGEGQTALHVALTASTRSGIFAKEAATALIYGGANVHATTANGKSCLELVGRDAELLDLLLEHGATVTPESLFAAVDANDAKVVEVLLSRGADPNLKPEPQERSASSRKALARRPLRHCDESQRLALYYAATKCDARMDEVMHQRIIQLLLEHGADPMGKFLEPTRRVDEDEVEDSMSDDDEIEDEQVCTIYVAAQETPSIEVPRHHRERTILHSLIQANIPIKMLLEVPGIDINHKDAAGMTPLLAACSQEAISRDQHVDPGATAAFDMLMAMGADVNAADNAGRNALHHLSQRRLPASTAHIAALERIAKLSPQLVNAPDTGGCSPLHLALRDHRSERCTSKIDKLMELGADATAVTKGGDTVLHILAPHCSNKDGQNLFSRFLKEHKLDINARNDRGETPLFHWVLGGRFMVKTQRFCTRRSWVDTLERRVANGTTFFKYHGAEFSARDARGRTLLHRAANCEAVLFKALMELGADVFCEDDRQQTALDVAAAKENKDVLKLFKKK